MPVATAGKNGLMSKKMMVDMPVSFMSNVNNLIMLTKDFSDSYKRKIIRVFGNFGGSFITDLIISLQTMPGDVSFQVEVVYIIEPEKKYFKLYEKDKMIYLYFTSTAEPFTGFVQSSDGVKSTWLTVDNTYTEIPIE